MMSAKRGRCGGRGARGVRWLLVAGMLGGVVAGSNAQSSAPVDAVALVRRAVQLRLAEEKQHRPVEYVLRKRDGDHETTKQIVETEDGDVARLIAINGKPLNAEQERAELNRLDALAAHPELQIHRRHTEQRDAARMDQLMGMLPDSEVYTLVGSTPCGAGSCWRLRFVTNPEFYAAEPGGGGAEGVCG